MPGSRDEVARETQKVLEREDALEQRGRLALLVLTAEGMREFDLSQLERWTVGRFPPAEVFIDDASVSRAHARLTASADGLRIEDLGSTNGTFLNGVRLGPGDAALKPGDAVRFGNVQGFVHLIVAHAAAHARVVPLREFDARLEEEANRCLQFVRSLAVLSIEIDGASDSAVEAAQSALAKDLRFTDVISVPARGRLQVLVGESSKQEAIACAEQLSRLLADRGLAARIGVAAFPGDAPTAQTVTLAAMTALRSAPGPGVGIARESARILKIGAHEIIIAEPAMVRLFQLVDRAAALPMPALVVGETGCGKEIVAEALHALGPRARKPLVKLNCAAVPESLLESELLGHEAGAFSGALHAKPGLVEQADGGTLFLDEISEMPLALQAKVLRIVEDRSVRRLGAVKDHGVDVRVVAATNRDLKSACAEGRFREDLFYRLSAIVLTVPPLRDRRREILLLAQRFAAEAAQAAGRSPIALSAAVQVAVENYAWPGNVRELKNVMSRAIVGCDGDQIDLAHLPAEVAGPSPRPAAATATSETQPAPGRASLADELRAIERQRILDAMQTCGGNQTQAAKLLNMPRRTLVTKLAALGIGSRRRRID